jgi:UDP:flavonoid glycosyltransferase YjiC (YdhE family)
MALWLGRAALNGVPNTWRSQVVGLPPAPIELLPPHGEICLYGFCRSLLPPPSDWPPGVVVTGAWWLDTPTGWRPPAELERFLRSSGKVIFLGFGSMLDARPGKLNAIVEAALARLGCRAVLLAGPAGQLDLPPSPRWLAVRDIPFEWLFRRMDAIIHHGGAGTTAQAARAGKPSVAVPFFGDQLFWGQRIHRAGGGPRPIPRRGLTPQRLVSAIDEALHDPRSAERAAFLGTQVRAETGLSTAVNLIEASCRG